MFDTTLFLKPIHFDDYDSILLRLIKSAPEKKKALEELIEKKIEKSLPYSFRWIKHGTNLTLRDLKDRLNHAVPLISIEAVEADQREYLCTLELKKQYLKEFYKFKEEKDSIAFQRLICKPENIKLVDSVELKESIYQRLWDSNSTHKGLFTRFWNKEWAKKLSQAQPV